MEIPADRPGLHQLRVAFFTPGNLGPHHTARFQRLLTAYPHARVVNVRWEDPRQWDADPAVFQGRLTVIEGIPGQDFARTGTAAVLSFLQHYRPEVVVLAGYNDVTQIAAARWAKKHRVARILQSDSWYGDRPRYRLKECIKRYVYIQPHFEAGFVPGERACRYLQSLGVPPQAIWRGSYVVDNDYFSQQAAQVRRDPLATRRRLALPSDYFLTVARLSPEKNIARLLEAFRRYRERGGTWSLVVVGDGPLAGPLRALAQPQGRSQVIFAGWRHYDELPAYYALAGCLVLPSISEPWGLVVNEAMACGLPVLVSRQCGCLPELCRPGVNGWDFDPRDADGLSHLLSRIADGSLDLKALGAASRRLISGFSLDSWLDSLTDCMVATGRRRPPPEAP